MKSPLIFLQSTLKSFLITCQRMTDHTYRKIVGVPTLRYSEISPQLFLGGQYSRRGYDILKQRGITAIVSMRMRPRADLPDMGSVKFLHLPTPDLTPPTIKNLEKGAKFIAKEIAAGGKVYVHCHYGEGRGPSMVAAYLMSTGLTLDDALKQIKAVRGFVALKTAQVARMKEYEQIVQHQKKK